MTMFRLEELGTCKATIRKRFIADYERPADDEWSNRVKTLLASRRTAFTLTELDDLIDVFDTSHHNCVLDNMFEFHPLVVSTHIRLEKKIEAWRDYIRQRRLADAPSY